VTRAAAQSMAQPWRSNGANRSAPSLICAYSPMAMAQTPFGIGPTAHSWRTDGAMALALRHPHRPRPPGMGCGFRNGWSAGDRMHLTRRIFSPLLIFLIKRWPLNQRLVENQRKIKAWHAGENRPGLLSHVEVRTTADGVDVCDQRIDRREPCNPRMYGGVAPKKHSGP